MIHLACSYPITSELHDICKPRKSIHFDPRTPPPRPPLALSVLTLVGNLPPLIRSFQCPRFRLYSFPNNKRLCYVELGMIFLTSKFQVFISSGTGDICTFEIRSKRPPCPLVKKFDINVYH
eukprot:sb/3476108/